MSEIGALFPTDADHLEQYEAFYQIVLPDIDISKQFEPWLDRLNAMLMENKTSLPSLLKLIELTLHRHNNDVHLHAYYTKWTEKLLHLFSVSVLSMSTLSSWVNRQRPTKKRVRRYRVALASFPRVVWAIMKWFGIW